MKLSFSSYIIFPLLIYSVYLSSLIGVKVFSRVLPDANATQVPNSNARPNNLSLKQNSSRNSSLSVTAGSGWITHSDYPDIISPGYGLNVSDGGYEPQSNTILLNINDRYVEMLLSEPLRDGKTIQFVVTRIIKYVPENLFSRFVIPTLSIDKIVQSGGQLRKTGNEIRGQFTVEGILTPPKDIRWSETTGSISGEFVLRITDGTSPIFQLRPWRGRAFFGSRRP
jgi:hypothetical protein